MINEFVKKWEEKKSKLEEIFKTTRQQEYSSYKDIVALVVATIINNDDDMDDYNNYDNSKMRVIDDGDYQGTQIFIIPKCTYQPRVEDYIYTHSYYGSCSGCDTLLSISSYDDELPSDEQVKDYMQLALHILQRFKYLVEEEKK